MTPLPTVAEMVDDTGLHPIADGRAARGRHASPWTAERVARDARLALLACGVFGRRARLPLGAYLLPQDHAAALWSLRAMAGRT